MATDPPTDPLRFSFGPLPMTVTTVAALVAVTEEARQALSARYAVRIARFPFRAGRESRSPKLALPPPVVERRSGVAPQINDVYLLDSVRPQTQRISREHFAIECVGQEFFVIDRGSRSGTIVAGIRVGGNRTGGRTALRDGDLIVVGEPDWQFVYRFEMMRAD